MKRTNSILIVAATMVGGCMVEYPGESRQSAEQDAMSSSDSRTVTSDANVVADSGMTIADANVNVTPDVGMPDSGMNTVQDVGTPDAGTLVVDVVSPPDVMSTLDVAISDVSTDTGSSVDVGTDTGYDAGRDSGTDVVTIVPPLDPTARVRVASAAMGLPLEIREVWPRTRTLCNHEAYQTGLNATTSNVFTRCDFAPEFDEAGGRMRIQVLQRGLPVSGVSADTCSLLLPIWKFGIFNAVSGRELNWLPESRLIERPGEAPLFMCDITIPRSLTSNPYGFDLSDFEFEAVYELGRLDAGVDSGSVVDASADTGHDSGTDTGTDVGFDGGADAGTDVGIQDSGTDVGTDTGVDASVATYWYRYIVTTGYWGATSGHMFVDDSTAFQPMSCLNADVVTTLPSGDVQVLCQLPRQDSFLGRFSVRGTPVHTTYALTSGTTSSCVQSPGIGEVAVFSARPTATSVALPGLTHVLVGGWQCRHRLP